MKDILVNERYRIERKVADGGQAVVYSEAWDMMEDEEAIYNELAGGGAPGFPRVFHAGEEGTCQVMVQELLGPALDDLLAYCGGRFSLKTVLLLADQAIRRVQHVHSRNILHCDMKPENLLMGLGANGNTLYLVDYGIAGRFYPTYPQETTSADYFVGTVFYAPLNSHRRKEPSWGDDLESLGYMLVYMIKGMLPWGTPKRMINGKFTGRMQEAEETGKIKLAMTPAQICADLPPEFATYLGYAQSLPYGTRPDYAYLRRLFRRLFLRRGFRDIISMDSEIRESGTLSIYFYVVTSPELVSVLNSLEVFSNI
ncbi:hypothetical protein N3K66_005910 [Trichothecium roseum]|uniref:Uncharacterized protein n=1 Tax=Trichothecium roseum TaxID=47278 RepID=A0ACC0V0L2_9HYPO|nr:hypothetical protein N3K66_005910 [Trichothecium roseum]